MQWIPIAPHERTTLFKPGYLANASGLANEPRLGDFSSSWCAMAVLHILWSLFLLNTILVLSGTIDTVVATGSVATIEPATAGVALTLSWQGIR